MRNRIVLALLLVLGTQRGVAQDSGCAPALPDKAALVRALDSSMVPPARIALTGEPVVGWALEIARDSLAPARRRARALAVLRLARWKPAIGPLTALATPLKGDWVVWQGALNALASYPYVELEPWWLDMITFPRRDVRETALRGLSLVGTRHDLPMIDESTHRDRDAQMEALVARVRARIALPIAQRDTADFGWPPDSLGGKYVAATPASSRCSASPRSH